MYSYSRVSPGGSGEGRGIAHGLAGIDHLLNLALQARGEFGRVFEVEEVFAQRLVERFLPEREQRAVDISEAAFQVEGIREIGRVGKGDVEGVPLLPQPLLRAFLFGDIAPFGNDQHDLALLVSDRVEGYVEVLPLTGGRRTVASKRTNSPAAARVACRTLSGAPGVCANHGPPRTGADDFLARVAGEFQRGAIRFEQRSIGRHEADVLVRAVVDGAEPLFAFAQPRLGLLSARSIRGNRRKCRPARWGTP